MNEIAMSRMYPIVVLSNLIRLPSNGRRNEQKKELNLFVCLIFLSQIGDVLVFTNLDIMCDIVLQLLDVRAQHENDCIYILTVHGR